MNLYEEFAYNVEGNLRLVTEAIRNQYNVNMNIWQYTILDKTKDYTLKLNSNTFSIAKGIGVVY